MSDLTDAQRAAEIHDDAVMQAHRLAVATRRAQLRGDHQRLLDGQGIHPFSEAVGRVRALRELFPEIAGADLDPVRLRLAAELEAQERWVASIVVDGPDQAFERTTTP
jgi:hypothetical protein